MRGLVCTVPRHPSRMGVPGEGRPALHRHQRATCNLRRQLRTTAAHPDISRSNVACFMAILAHFMATKFLTVAIVAHVVASASADFAVI